MHNTATATNYTADQPRIFALADTHGISDEVVDLICRAAEGQDAAKCELAADHYITVNDLGGGDFEVVQRCFFTLSAYN